MARNLKQKAQAHKVAPAARPERRAIEKKEEESMEAKVDVRKLQILNDRINQTIDALSQVRLSVHGLGHTGVPQMLSPFGVLPGYGYPTLPSFPVPPIGAIPPIPPVPGPFGLSHTPFTPFVNPLFNIPTPFTTPFTSPMVNPLLSSLPTPGITPNWPPTPWMGFGGGILHSPIDPFELRLLEARALDPFRIRETFPFVNY